MGDDYQQDEQDDGDDGRFLLEQGGNLEDKDYDRAYVAQAEDNEGRFERPDEETFDHLKERWDDLDPEQRQRVYDSLSHRQQKEISKEYGTLQGGSNLREYDADNEGLDEDRFQQSYESWDELDPEERQERWQQMNGEQKRKIKNEYASSSFSDDDGLDETYEDWMVSPDEWNQKDPEEREQLWYSGRLSLKERRTMAASDEYRLDDMEMDPSQYEDESWFNMTKPEQLAIVESDEYDVEDFGKEGYRPRGSDGSLAGMFTGAATGTATINFTWPMITSGNPETAMTGVAFQTASSLGGFALGSIASGGMSIPEKQQTFSDDDIQEAYREKQRQLEEEQEEPEDQDWNLVGKVAQAVSGTNDEPDEEAGEG
ncbi:MAG: hypothetical protein SV186_02760 [Candidatus Nanohaloarchaea archaeon]|nr:hypothetical protein [Candidatus Nanohaloarchaea archaeon]